MPVITIETRTGLNSATKAKIATDLTTIIRETIKSPDDLISVVFHNLLAEDTYRSGEPTTDTLIFCHIRHGRSDGAIVRLAKMVSKAWSEHTNASENTIEVLVAQYQAKYVIRGGERLPEPVSV